MLLVEAQQYLEIVRTRGEAGLELKRVYYNIVTNEELFLKAYANLYANDGAMTPGVTPHDTVDGMSVKRIKSLIQRLKKREYQWTPVKRVYIGKNNSSKKRPLGLPGFNDKLLQEVMRMVLETYYGPQFRGSSHGFRPQRGCHTALDEIAWWKGSRWFIEGDIKGCFDNISHEVTLGILRRRIKDPSLLALIRDMLQAGYMEEWAYHNTYTGTPQGGIISPLLANIVLHELDTFVEDVLIPEYTRGKERRFNKEYTKLAGQERQARRKGDWDKAKEIRKRYITLPSRMPNDPEFKRLKYIRYADDFLLGFIGTVTEAKMIKRKLSDFLKSLRLEMSKEKTLITHARTGKARFLNYHINLISGDDKTRKVTCHGKVGRHTKRTITQQLFFGVPEDVIRSWRAKVEKYGKIHHRAELLNYSDYDIIMTYEIELQGLINYYNRVHNQEELRQLRYRWKESLLKTLANKHKMSTNRTRKKYEKFYTANGERIIGVEIQREGKKPLRATFGKRLIQRQKKKAFTEEVQTLYINRNGLLDRLLAEHCELCGRENVELQGHHVRKLKDLNTKWKGKKEKPLWVHKMIGMKRKTLFVCEGCHQKIHAGTYDGRKIT